MRKKVLTATVSCCFLAVVAVTAVYAQLPGTALHATIPFDFTVRGKVLPAGDYEIKRINDSAEVLVISCLDRHKNETALFETQAAAESQSPAKGELVFHRYGDTYFLSEVFGGGEQTGRELFTSRQELTLKRELASEGNGPRVETVALVAY